MGRKKLSNSDLSANEVVLDDATGDVDASVLRNTSVVPDDTAEFGAKMHNVLKLSGITEYDADIIERLYKKNVSASMAADLLDALNHPEKGKSAQTFAMAQKFKLVPLSTKALVMYLERFSRVSKEVDTVLSRAARRLQSVFEEHVKIENEESLSANGVAE